MRLLLLLLLLLLASGCAMTSPQVASVLDSLPPAEPVTCQDSSTEWDRAQLWIVKHSEYKVQSATNVMIQTYNPRDSGSPSRRSPYRAGA